MKVWTCLLFCALIQCCLSVDYDNITMVEPALRQLYDFKQTHKTPIGLLTTGAGEPIDIRDTLALNSDQFSNPFNMDYYLSHIAERVPERIVHAKGVGAEGYFEVTNDVTEYSSADLFSEVGKKTPIIARFSVSFPGQGGTDLLKDFKSMSVKFYTKEGNLDLLCLHTPVYSYKDPIHFPNLVRIIKPNPNSHLPDPTLIWDFITLRPENLHTFLWLESDYGLPNGYRRMDVFPIHTYEISNKHGKVHYVKFNFRTEQGLANLTNAQAAAIQSVDLDYFTRDLYNAIKRKEYPSWRLEMDVMTPKDLKKLDYDPFDVTRMWKNGTYKTVQIGRVVYKQTPKNHFRSVEQLALNPANLVPGISGPVTPIGLLTTGAGEPIDIRDTLALNSDQFSNPFNMDYYLSHIAERVPERIVHAKGVGAEGYFEVTNDVTEYSSADLFSEVGKKTPIIARFSVSFPGQGGTDLLKDFKSMSVKFYTKEGNLDLLCLHTPVYSYKDPIHFPNLVRIIKPNPNSHLPDPTLIWDFITLRPENLHTFLWLESDYGLPNGYRRMDVFPIHTYEISNKHGKVHYVKFNFRTEQGLANLTNAQAAAIQSVDLDYFTRDLYNAIKRKEYPSWRLEMDVMTPKDLKKLDYDPFDVTRMWKNGTYKTVQIGRVVYKQTPKNHFRSVEQLALNPANLVPGISGPVDMMFTTRRLVYRASENHRISANHNRVGVNLPRYAKNYVRDGRPPVNENMEDAPNYYPNSFSGPVPYVDDRRPDKKLSVIQPNAIDLQPSADFYNNILTNDAQRQRLADSLVRTLVNVNPPVRKRGLKFMYLIDKDLGRRVETSLKAALLAASAATSKK